MLPSLLLAFLFSHTSAQYGLYGGGGYGGYGGYGGGIPFMPDPYMNSQVLTGTEANQRDCRGLPSMRARSICRYGNPMMGGIGGMTALGSGYGSGYSSGLGAGLGSALGSGVFGGCTDMNPQCSVWASTGQCATNPIMMRQTCALSCGTCATGLTAGSASFYNPFSLGGMSSTGLDQYPLAQFIGRSIYETGRETRDQHENVNMSRDPATATHFKGAWSPRF